MMMKTFGGLRDTLKDLTYFLQAQRLVFGGQKVIFRGLDITLGIEFGVVVWFT
jgi:hypothetical protein